MRIFGKARAGGGASGGVGEGRLFRDGGHGLRSGETAYGARAGPPRHPCHRLKTRSPHRKRHQRLPGFEAVRRGMRETEVSDGRNVSLIDHFGKLFGFLKGIS